MSQAQLKIIAFKEKNFKNKKNSLDLPHFTENKVVPAKFKESRKNISWEQDVLETNIICLNIIKKFCYEKIYH